MTELRIGGSDFDSLHGHLHQDDRDEHAAILLASERETVEGLILTVREVHPLGADEFPPGEHGYRQLAASALARLGNRADDHGLALVSVHSHPLSDERTALSGDDLAAHERVFGHLLDITGASSVTGIAFGARSAAGEVWRSDGRRTPLDRVRVVGPNVRFLRPMTGIDDGGECAGARFDRQVRLFGAAGQARLRDLRVGVVGAGGGGSILVEQLAHLGVGHLTVIDDDIVKVHNLSRIMGAAERDARKATKKVAVAARMVRAIDPSIDIEAVDGNIADRRVAERLIDCDFLFLATDTATARLVGNAVAQSFLIPLVQIGAKVDARPSGDIEQIYTAVRPVLPRRGCLACAGLIDPVLLQREAATPEERENQNYLGDFDIVDPSVTTLNAAAAAGALNVFLMAVIDEADDELAEHRITLTRDGTTLINRVVPRPECRWCGTGLRSRYAVANVDLLPCRQPADDAPAGGRSSLLRRLLRGRRSRPLAR